MFLFGSTKTKKADQNVLRIKQSSINLKGDRNSQTQTGLFAGLTFARERILGLDEMSSVGFDACLNRSLGLSASLASTVAVLAVNATNKLVTLLVSEGASADVIRSVVSQIELAGVKFESKAIQARWCSAAVVNAVVSGDFSPQQSRGLKTSGQSGVSQSALWLSFVDIVEWASANDANDIDFKISLKSAGSAVFFKINGRYITLPRWSLPTETLVSMLGIVWQHSKGGSGSKFEPNQEQQCNVDITLRNKTRLRLRWASMSTDRGVTVTFRVQTLGSSRVVQTLEECGYLPEHVDIFRRVVAGKGGLTTLAGTVGSGKTLTLAILMNMLPDDTKIVSFEDPVEIENEKIHQKSISRDLVGDDDGAFQAGVRALFRSALDVFMMGEVRDIATGRVVRAVLESGHSGYTTTHAASALGIFSKYASPQVGIPLDVLGDPGMLKLNVYQALMLRNCKCALPAKELGKTLSGDDLQRHNSMLSSIERLYGLAPEIFRMRNPHGCPECARPGFSALNGTRGRTVVAEMIEPDETMCELLGSGKKVDLLRYWRGLSDMDIMSDNLTGKSVMEVALLKAASGLLDPAEIERQFEPFSAVAARRAQASRRPVVPAHLTIAGVA